MAFDFNVGVMCEESGTVRDAFIERGVSAVSCDILPSSSNKGPHIQGDAMEVLNSKDWGVIIAHPPVLI